MKSSAAANRYAKSLLDFAKEKGQLEAAKADMTMVHGTVSASRELSLMLASPVIKADAKQKVLNKVFGKAISPLSIGFLNLLTSKGREPMLGQIAHAFIQLYRSENGIINAEVISAVKMTDKWKTALEKSVSKTGNSIEFSETIDPSILGGLRIKVGDQLIDASLRRKLHELKQEISN